MGVEKEREGNKREGNKREGKKRKEKERKEKEIKEKERKGKKRKGNLTMAGKEKRKERESYSDGRSRKSEWI